MPDLFVSSTIVWNKAVFRFKIVQVEQFIIYGVRFLSSYKITIGFIQLKYTAIKMLLKYEWFKYFKRLQIICAAFKKIYNLQTWQRLFFTLDNYKLNIKYFASADFVISSPNGGLSCKNLRCVLMQKMENQHLTLS